MSPLALIKRNIERKDRLSSAQMAHLRAKAYRGVRYTQAKQGQEIHGSLTYRGLSYSK
jgi:hypothetical protein